ncbi:unnamed protein product, partial [Meganyctiphanes norvegica]
MLHEANSLLPLRVTIILQQSFFLLVIGGYMAIRHTFFLISMYHSFRHEHLKNMFGCPLSENFILLLNNPPPPPPPIIKVTRQRVTQSNNHIEDPADKNINIDELLDEVTQWI